MNKRYKEKKRNQSMIGKLLICLFVLCCCSWLISSVFSSDADSRGNLGGVDPAKFQETDVPEWITQDFLPVNEYSRPGIALEEINGIVVHYVANPGSTGWENRHYFEGLAQSHETKAGAHFVIGLDGTIIQCVPLTELTYCSNSRNVDTISIECCHPEADGKFTEETYQSLVKLCKWLMERYALEAEDVIRHYDVTGKLCPLYFVEHEDAWESFQESLK